MDNLGGLVSGPLLGTQRLGVRVQTLRFEFDPEILEGGPVAIRIDRSQVQHGLCSRDFPTHARSFHAVFDDVAARAFNHARCDRTTQLQVLVVTHPMLVLRQKAADTRQGFFLGVRQTLPLAATPPIHSRKFFRELRIMRLVKGQVEQSMNNHF